MKKISSEIIVTTFNQSDYYLRDFMEREIKTCFKSYHKPLITLIFERNEIQKANNLDSFLSPKYSKEQYKILINNKGRGFPSCLNFGILNSKSKYIFRLDTDDHSHESRYDKQIEILERNKAFICYSDIFEKETNKKITFPNINLLYLFVMIGLNPIPHISVCFNRNYILKNFGLYDEDLKRSEDFNLWIRALIIKGKDVFIKAEQPLVYYSTAAFFGKK